jgi:hypothetical protein
MTTISVSSSTMNGRDARLLFSDEERARRPFYLGDDGPSSPSQVLAPATLAAAAVSQNGASPV